MWKCFLCVRRRAVNWCRRLNREPGNRSWPNLFQSRKVVEWLPLFCSEDQQEAVVGAASMFTQTFYKAPQWQPVLNTQPVHLDHTDWKSHIKWFTSGNSDPVLSWHGQCSIKLRSITLLLFQVISVPCALFCAEVGGPWDFFLFPLANDTNQFLGDYVRNLGATLPNLTVKSQPVGLVPLTTCLQKRWTTSRKLTEGVSVRTWATKFPIGRNT